MYGQQQIALRVVRMGITLVFYISDRVTLGRGSSGDPEVPHIDLDPYDAQNLAVAPLHAVLKLDSGTLYIIDQNSASGVFVDQERIRSKSPFALRDWSTIQLGAMPLEVRFPPYRVGTIANSLFPSS
ncbi:MAG: FHA domain-containing protein [Chloroflexi bacterium]|nr:FHA domain-containing protein [Chloroflexota bacterium]